MDFWCARWQAAAWATNQAAAAGAAGLSYVQPTERLHDKNSCQGRGHFTMTKGSIHQESLILKADVPLNKASKYMENEKTPRL